MTEEEMRALVEWLIRTEEECARAIGDTLEAIIARAIAAAEAA